MGKPSTCMASLSTLDRLRILAWSFSAEKSNGQSCDPEIDVVLDLRREEVEQKDEDRLMLRKQPPKSMT
eukprot:3932270-Rhodomonas_salina.1